MMFPMRTCAAQGISKPWAVPWGQAALAELCLCPGHGAGPFLLLELELGWALTTSARPGGHISLLSGQGRGAAAGRERSRCLSLAGSAAGSRTFT